MAGTIRLSLLLLAGCAPEQIQLLLDGNLPNRGDTIPGLLSLSIEPSAASVISDGRAPGETIAFRAIGRVDGGERDVTTEVRWSISELGTIDGGQVVTSENVGGVALVRASAGAIEASAELTVRLDVVEPLGGAPELPDDTGADLASGAVAIIYPAAGTTFPANIEHVRHQWVSTLASPRYEIRFESSIARIRIHSREPHFELDERSAGWIPRTHAGRSVTMTVRAVEDGSSVIHRSEPRVFHYARSEIRGSALYWSTTAKTIKHASLATPRALDFLPGEDGCVSCHAVSRDGRTVAVAIDGDELALFDGESREPISVDGDDRDYAFSTFSPDGSRLLVAHDGELVLYDLDDQDRDQIQMEGMSLTHPDWSPDGRWIAVAMRSGAEDFADKNVSGTSIARIEVDDDFDLGDLEILVPSDGDTLAFPSYSPDGRFIAFVRATGGAKDNVTSHIQLIAADGNSAPVTLGVLNGGGGNSIPTWASTTDPSIQWLAFSSQRDYGSVLVGLGRDQLWISAIDTDRAAAGSDPSSPAFWIPFQDAEEWNHRALWTQLPGPTSPACQPSPEACNGRDDDCDLVTDEGCDCAIVEICGNEADDDCDELADSEDEDC